MGPRQMDVVAEDPPLGRRSRRKLWPASPRAFQGRNTHHVRQPFDISDPGRWRQRTHRPGVEQKGESMELDRAEAQATAGYPLRRLAAYSRGADFTQPLRPPGY